MDPAPGSRPARGERPCPKCGRLTQGSANFFEFVHVVEGPNGAISTYSEEHLEYLCGWCGTRLGPARPIVVEDVGPL
ncbi:MAG: hypothetical protein OEY23_05600 [Acidimicrobiia bacterium]|nr:hypothetical protein [Acidimicrobiia bacterium]